MKKIALYARIGKDPSFENLIRCAQYLSDKYEILLEEELASYCKDRRFRYLPLEKAVAESDVLIVLGGDGTILSAARVAAPLGKPILGINLGHLGYMAQAGMDGLPEISRLLENFGTEERFMLSISLLRDGKTVVREDALNDVVVRSLDNGIIDLSCDANGQRIFQYRTDGMIASTPTGSTAYSMSAGGAIVDPELSAILLVPICAHTFKARQVIFSPDSTVRMHLVNTTGSAAGIYIDGNRFSDVHPGDEVEITRSSLRTTFVKFSKDSFCRTVYEKMRDY